MGKKLTIHNSQFTMFVLILAGVLMLAGCGTTVYQLKTDCDKATPEDLFKNISMLLMQENFIIKQSDSKLGYLQAETMPSYNIWTGMNEVRIWVFQYTQGKVVASAKIAAQKQNIFGASRGSAEVYYNDKVHESWGWYWNIRNGLEKICGNKITIEELKVN